MLLDSKFVLFIRYNWDVADFSYYLSIQRICRFVGLFLLLPFLSKILKCSDALVASLGTILTVVAYVLMAIGTKEWLGPGALSFHASKLCIGDLINPDRQIVLYHDHINF